MSSGRKLSTGFKFVRKLPSPTPPQNERYKRKSSKELLWWSFGKEVYGPGFGYLTRIIREGVCVGEAMVLWIWAFFKP
eukprot:873212-Amphidinium_carterae.1